MLPVGSLIAGYRVERVLGAGGMGTVYLVANPELPRRDALKLLSTELSHDEQFRARFVREADVASRLSHPNIVTIYRRGRTEDGRLWIAMQFVDGIDADDALNRGEMTPQRAVYIVGEIGKALDYAHHRGVIHRDVKPANFLLENSPGSDERVLLGDFGIARALDDTSLTATGSMVATVAYAAPEVLSGRPVDGRADLYSLGCTLFRMLTGRTPFADAHGAPAVMMAHLNQPPPRPSEFAPWLPRAFDAVISTAMAKDPAHRFSSGAELAAAARAALHGGPPASAPPAGQPGFYGAPTQLSTPGTAAWREPAPPRRRGKILAALAGVAVLAVAATTTVVLASRSPGDDAAAPPPPASETSTTTTTGPPPPTVSATALDGVMLPAEQLAGMIGAPSLTKYGSMDSPAEDSPTIEEKECLSAWAPGQRAVYSELGWVAARNQGFQDQPQMPAYRVIEAVITLPSVAATEKLLAGQTEQWTKCANTRITLNYPTPPTPQRWTLGEPTRTGNMLTIIYTMEGGAGMGCQRALTAANNAAVDVLVCRTDVTDQAVTVAEALRAKIPA
ncbi:serine/threonine-protein kinase PknH/PknJ [Mycobacterium sp. 1274756.6]|uniref:serine/threonine-protein kinase PknH/PknJ n=1 Tax=Mycobacterium sp. 1274756.6 TaxID=1834076 RepID=UPI000802197C|nr:serine/threonine-protein kinase PknH/PknJ [Mycobacterium sp. 1274756.6]OBJ70189.1 hypothetical protein A5643_00935 [Mycobacterium sp. 1274756.6]